MLPVILIGVGLLLLFRRGGSGSVEVVKRKVDEADKPKRSYSEELQAKIDAALAEPDDQPTKPADPKLN